MHHSLPYIYLSGSRNMPTPTFTSFTGRSDYQICSLSYVSSDHHKIQICKWARIECVMQLNGEHAFIMHTRQSPTRTHENINRWKLYYVLTKRCLFKRILCVAQKRCITLLNSSSIFMHLSCLSVHYHLMLLARNSLLWNNESPSHKHFRLNQFFSFYNPSFIHEHFYVS